MRPATSTTDEPDERQADLMDTTLMDAITRSAQASPAKAPFAAAHDAATAFGGALAGLLGGRTEHVDDTDVAPVDLRDDDTRDPPALEADDEDDVPADAAAPAVLLPWLAQSRAIAVEPVSGDGSQARKPAVVGTLVRADAAERDVVRTRVAAEAAVDASDDVLLRRREASPMLSPAPRPPRFSFAPVPVPMPPPASPDTAGITGSPDLAALAEAIDAWPASSPVPSPHRGRHAAGTTRDTPAVAANPAPAVAADDAPLDTRIALGKADEGFGIALRGAASPEAPAPSQGSWISVAGTAMRSAAPAPAVVDPSPVADAEAWSQALAKHTMLLATGDLKEARLQIEGRQLGPIEVSVRLDGERVDVRFAIQHPITAMLVQDALPRLERMLEHQGLSLGHSSVDQGQAQAQANAQQRDGRHAAAEVRFGGTSHGVAGVDSEVVSAPRARAVPLGLLDDFA